MHKAFISYHHHLDQHYKEELLRINSIHGLFLDGSVDTGDIDENLPDESIRQIIRDDYLRDTTVTIVLVGTGTKGRKHVDWEIYSSMFDGTRNKKSGVIAVNLPTTGNGLCQVAHANEKTVIYPEIPPSSWITIETKSAMESRYPHMPQRLLDNVFAAGARISVVPWDKFIVPSNMSFLISAAYNDRASCEYDLSQPMRRQNS